MSGARYRDRLKSFERPDSFASPSLYVPPTHLIYRSGPDDLEFADYDRHYGPLRMGGRILFYWILNGLGKAGGPDVICDPSSSGCSTSA